MSAPATAFAPGATRSGGRWTLALFLLAISIAGPSRVSATEAPVRGGDGSDPAAQGTRVEEVSPSGTVKQPAQVTARFSAAMVALGDPRARPPLSVTCTPPVGGSGRWIDSRTYAFDFVRPLPGGERCAVEIAADARDLAGQPVTGQRRFEFSTGGPAVLETRPTEGSEVAEDQAFVLELDAEPAPASVLAHAYFAADGVAERIAVAIASPEVAGAILASDPGDRPSGPVVVLQARQRFPTESAVRLVWGKGIESTGGVATDEEQTFEWKTRPPFRAELRCDRENANAGCVPLAPISLRLTSSVSTALAAAVALVAPDGRRFAPEPPDTPEPQVTRVRFAPPFPPSSELRVEVPAGFVDDADRALANAEELRAIPIRVAALPPLAKFAARFGILEAKARPALPVTVRGLEPRVPTRVVGVPPVAGAAEAKASAKGSLVRLDAADAGAMMRWLLRVAGSRRDRSVFAGMPAASLPRTFDLPQPEGTAMQVVGIPIEKPGVYVVELESRVLGSSLLEKGGPMYVAAAALVTDLAVHLEWGREGSLVWVTSLEQAKPVAGAQVAVHDCSGKVLWRGESDADGIARIASLPREVELPVCSDPTASDDVDEHRDYAGSRSLAALTSGLLVTAQSGDDLGFVHSSWNEGIEPFRWNLPSAPWQGPYAAHTILARALLRAGDTAYMKHVFRTETLAGFALASPAERPSRLVIRHVGSNTEYPLPLMWESDGTAETAWPVPKEAKLGRYEVALIRPARVEAAGDRPPPPTPTPAPPYAWLGRSYESEREWIAGEFRVEEFRVPLLRTTVKLPPGPLVAPSEVPVDVAVRYLSGGAAAGLPVTVRSRISPGSVRAPEGLEDWSIGNGAVRLGVERLDASDGGDGDGSATGGGGEATAGPAGARRTPSATRETLRLDASGTARATLRHLAPPAQPSTLLVEAEVRDPNGETQTASSRTELWPASLLPALRADFRRDGKRRIDASVAVLDAERKLVPGVRVVVELLQRFTYTNRQRVVGGFYSYQDLSEVRRVKTLCRGRTGDGGRLHCRRRTPVDGDLVVQARIEDDRGRASAAHADVWVPGEDDAWFRMADSDRMDLIPDRRRYEPGETAHVQVRMPFRRATGLVTLGREGVLDARVVELSGKDPAIEVPIRDALSPNVFVQVLAVRGRVASIAPTATVDLGKPAFKMGIAELEVGWRPHELALRVETDRSVYTVRETAKVEIEAHPAAGTALPPDAAVAIAAVDEGLLELLPNPSVELLRAMMGRRGYEVDTATAQLQVVGKRHFGKKALPAGGGGGRQATRELFDTLLLWRGRVPLDASGKATIDVPLNDSLTSFRIVAVGTAGAGLFGTGEATIRATQDLMVLSGLAPVVRTGDRFRAEFTVRNTTDRALEVSLAGRADGLASPDLAAQRIALAPAEATTATWDVVAPAEPGTLRWEISADAGGGAADRLAVPQRVVAAVPTRTLQATLEQWTAPGPLVQPVALPADALPARGGVDVSLAPSLVAGLSGVREKMARYPYTCLEQRVSRAIALGDDALWSDVAGALAAYADGDGLLKFFPSMTWGDPSLTAYVIEVSRAAGRALPAPVEQRMKGGLRSFVDGTLPRRGEPPPDLALRKLEAAAALATAGAGSSDLVSGITVEPALWPTSAVLDWWTILLRTPSWPAAERAKRRAEAESVLRARLSLSGTALVLASGATAVAWPFGGEDVDPLRLLLLALESGTWRADQGRLARGALSRQERGAWDTTVANAWGTVALHRFAAAHESEPVGGTTSAALGGESRTLDWAKEPRGGTLQLPWPPATAPAPAGPSPAQLAIEHRGSGRPWITTATRAAVPLAAPLAAGYRIARTVTPIERRSPDAWSVGDTLRVRLEIDASADMPWVVVDDPVPSGASFLARGFATDATLAASAGSAPTPTPGTGALLDVSPAYEERGFEAYRAYFDRVPAGRFAVEYAIRLNQAGTLHLPPTHVEALYAPEVLGEVPNAPLEVVP